MRQDSQNNKRRTIGGRDGRIIGSKPDRRRNGGDVPAWLVQWLEDWGDWARQGGYDGDLAVRAQARAALQFVSRTPGEFSDPTLVAVVASEANGNGRIGTINIIMRTFLEFMPQMHAVMVMRYRDKLQFDEMTGVTKSTASRLHKDGCEYIRLTRAGILRLKQHERELAISLVAKYPDRYIAAPDLKRGCKRGNKVA